MYANNIFILYKENINKKNQLGMAVEVSGRLLTSAEISLLSKGLKLVPTLKDINKATLKQDLEAFGRKLQLALFS